MQAPSFPLQSILCIPGRKLNFVLKGSFPVGNLADVTYLPGYCLSVLQLFFALFWM